MSNVVNCAPEEAEVGMRVRLAWDPLEDGLNYPVFELERP